MAIVKKYLCKVVEFQSYLPGIYSVLFSSTKKFKYLPGQFLHLALDEYDGIGQWPDSRCFSIQSPPSSELLKITFSVKGKFTARMSEELDLGMEIWLKLPYGDIFNRGHEKSGCVFIAGGTGITPFLSLFNDDSFSEYHFPKLYVGFKDEKYNIFKKEIENSINYNKEIEIKYFYENRNGMLNVEDIFNENGITTYFISGPPLMIRNFKNFLQGKGLKANQIVTDDWE